MSLTEKVKQLHVSYLKNKIDTHETIHVQI